MESAKQSDGANANANANANSNTSSSTTSSSSSATTTTTAPVRTFTIQPPSAPSMRSAHADRPIRHLLRYVEAAHVPFQRAQSRYEIALFFYLLTHLLLQTYNIYGMNFYNYNIHLLSLCFAMVSKRLLANYFGLVRFWNPVSMSGPQLCINVAIGSMVLVNLSYLFIHLFNHHRLRDVLFLFYPLMVYVLMFGLEDGPDDFQRPSYMGNPQETERILSDRVKRLIYDTFECGYYAGFVPLKFLQSEYLYYDPLRCWFLFAYILVNSHVMLFCQLLSTSFMELYLLSHSLGHWKRHPHQNIDAPSWSQSVGPYKKNAVVKHRDFTWIAIGQHNTCEPGAIFPMLFYFFFSNPGWTQNLLLKVQGLVLVSLLAFVTNSNHWTVYGIMLVFNYYIFHQCLYCIKEPFLDPEIFHFYHLYEHSFDTGMFPFANMIRSRASGMYDLGDSSSSNSDEENTLRHPKSTPNQSAMSDSTNETNLRPTAAGISASKTQSH